jgi:hypothetical protein
MATDLQSPPIAVAAPIRALLDGLRRKIRAYVWIQGIALAVAWLALSFWITLALDWMIEPPPAFRALLLVAVAAVLLWLIYRYILSRAFVPLRDTSMAVLVERRYGEFQDSLLTSVELAEKPGHAAAFNRDMLSRTTDEALAHMPRVRVDELLQNTGLMRAAFAAIVLSLSVGAFALAAPDAFKTWVKRVLLMSEDLWPRKTRLSIDGFSDKSVKVARGGDFRVVARADRGHEIPEVVQIRYRSEDGNPGRENMNQESIGPGDASQPYSFEFKGLLSSVTFDIVGGDDRLRDYTIEVVDNPTVANMTLACVYPDYMRRSPRNLPVTGLMQIPMGTQVTIRASANKPLAMAKVERVAEQGFEPVMTITQFSGDERREFSFELPPLVEDQRLQFRLYDNDGIIGRNPVRLDLTAVADDAPKVGLALAGIGTAITTQARLPVAGEVADDYGIERIWFEYAVDQSEPRQAAFLASPSGKETVTLDRQTPEVLDLKELQEAEGIAAELEKKNGDGDANDESSDGSEKASKEGESDSEKTDDAKAAPFALKVGQRLSLVVKAQDQSTLAGGPFVGAGEKYQLDVVTPDQLLAMLEARELVLRQRFETIIEEFSATRDLLARVEFGTTKARGQANDGTTNEQRLKGAEPEDTAGREPDDSQKRPVDEETAVSPAEAASRARASRVLALERTLENSERSAHETRTVAGAFHEILEEMANNRIDTPALSGRLRDEIANPLSVIADKRLTELSVRLKELQKLIDDPTAGGTRLGDAVELADAILVEMRDILDKMIEMATYKELVEKLRKLIEQQEKLNQETKQQQVEKLKNLIEE